MHSSSSTSLLSRLFRIVNNSISATGGLLVGVVVQLHAGVHENVAHYYHRCKAG
jgi:hypothetical protein